MKLDVLFFAASAATITVAGQSVQHQAFSYEFMAAICAASVISLSFSVLKSRARKASGVDTSLWAMIAFVGSWGLAFTISPMLAGREIMGIVLLKPAVGFLIALGAMPFIEWVLAAGAMKWALRFLPKGDEA